MIPSGILSVKFYPYWLPLDDKIKHFTSSILLRRVHAKKVTLWMNMKLAASSQFSRNVFSIWAAWTPDNIEIQKSYLACHTCFKFCTLWQGMTIGLWSPSPIEASFSRHGGPFLKMLPNRPTLKMPNRILDSWWRNSDLAIK